MQGSDSTIIAIFVVSALIVLVLGVVIVSFVLLYQRRVLQQQVSLQNLEVAFQKDLLAATLESQEAERSRIAKDLHDSVGVMLSTLQLVIRRYGSKGETVEEKDEMVTRSTAIIDSTIGTVRRISHDLLPPELEMMGLGPALEHLAWSVNEAGQLQVRLEVTENLERMPVGKEIALFRIVQELLNNTLKHSGATQSAIRLRRNSDGIVLRYSDNGRGIPRQLTEPGRREGWGLGLRNIESRAGFLGASVVWDTETTSGMDVEIVFTYSPVRS